jgi:hypothetical protein
MMATVVGVLGLVALFLGAGWHYYAADIKVLLTVTQSGLSRYVLNRITP